MASVPHFNEIQKTPGRWLEDFIYEQSGTVMISTYRKSKGREFDNVFLTITRPVKDDEKRTLYVAMTRAKRKLAILANGNFLKPCPGIQLITLIFLVNLENPWK